MLSIGLLIPFSSASAATGDRPDVDGESALGSETSLGTPVTEVVNHGVGYTTDRDGRSIGIFVARGHPSIVNVVDIDSGELLRTQSLTDVYQAWSFVTDKDRSIYIGSDTAGAVHRFDPDTLEFEDLSRAPSGQTHLWATGITSTGRVVYGTFPGAKVLSYDPSDDAWTDHGSPVSGNRYVRSLALYGDDVAYAGTGAVAVLARVDLQTNESEILDNPPGEDGQEFIYNLDVRGDLLFARYSPSGNLHVMDLTTHDWVDVIQASGGNGVSPIFQRSGADGPREVMVLLRDGSSVTYDIDSGETHPACLVHSGNTRTWNQVPMNIAGASEDVLVLGTWTGKFHIYDPQSDECGLREPEVQGAGATIRAIVNGPDSQIYAGGAGLTRVDPETGDFVALPLSGQVQQLHSHGDYVVAGTYTRAGVAFYDTSKPIDNGTNPRPSVFLGAGQDRVVAMTSVDDKVAVGSYPSPGGSGGALAIIDPDTLDMDVYPEPVEDQSVLALEYKDGLIYGGTGVSGGLDVPRQPDGKLFVFDPSSGEVVFEMAPVPGDGHVSGLTFDDDGNLWGVTRNAVFKFDIETREVTAVQRYFDFDDSLTYYIGRNIEWVDDRLVAVTGGLVGGTLFEVDPNSMEKTDLQSGVGLLAADQAGALYYGRDEELFRWAFAAKDCTDTISGEHRGPLTVTAGSLCLEGASVYGPVSLAPGASISVEDSLIRGPVSFDRATSAEVSSSRVYGPIQAHGMEGDLRLVDNELNGRVSITDGTVDSTISISGNRIFGNLRCVGNQNKPDNEGVPNSIRGTASGQCADL